MQCVADRSAHFHAGHFTFTRDHVATWPGTCSLSPILRITQWDCGDDCQYLCTRAHAAATNAEHQYHGKWAFRRLFGLQEPASVLFSLLNGWQHFRGLRRVSHLRPWTPAGTKGRTWVLVYAVASLHLWLWSVLFHARDTRVTERGDYAGAALAGVVALQWALARVVHFPPLPAIILTLAAFIYHVHVHLLSGPRIDYAGNMLFNIGVVIVHHLLWAVWAVRHRHRPYARDALLFVVLFLTASLLEVGDFAPVCWETVDTHALWHLATVPLIPLWYRFLVADLRAMDDEARSALPVRAK
ncbi:hypothetical protein AMAG_17094 [Allomyces macrogynus ATCC 38327]|uniref:Post-GPI attachment to proteins factor 3 n=1 Tax=Allomyces macrogynus (strain ATCC 38327) TaxID=578462 RepID=A0A0L0TDL2_ALLM3|nr:hypothetical protein AMAG_17094 [Allomyces macrogynus ATCC 38327]|eukprot:KNE72766.1 hypothetical protein AMAG_17094 [Allomyces macrogynus ATCC 38327]